MLQNGGSDSPNGIANLFASMLRSLKSCLILCIYPKGWSGVLGLGGYIDVAGEKVARMMGGLGRREEKGRDLLGPVLKGWCRIQ